MIGRTIEFRVSVNMPGHWNETWWFDGATIEHVQETSITAKYKDQYYQVRNCNWWYSNCKIPSCKIFFKR